MARIPSSKQAAPGRPSRGVALLELVIVFSVLGLLASLAWPSLVEPMRKARRTEAIAELLQVSSAQERWRSSHATYSDNLGHATGLGLAPADTARSYRSPGGLYDITLTVGGHAAQQYTVQARAVGAMASDARCPLFRLTMVDGVLTHSTDPEANTTRCWGR